MKKIYILLILVPLLSCKAQIIPYDSDESIFIPNSGVYYKDTNNDFNPFIGEWLWQDNIANSSIAFSFKKLENIETSTGFNCDLLVGEYQYIENGQELANTLYNINNPNISGRQHKISGVTLLTKYNQPECSECDENEKRIKVGIEHDNYEGVQGWLLMRHFIENGVEKLKVIVTDGSWLATDDNAPDNIDIPFGEYLLIKQ